MWVERNWGWLWSVRGHGLHFLPIMDFLSVFRDLRQPDELSEPSRFSFIFVLISPASPPDAHNFFSAAVFLLS